MAGTLNSGTVVTTILSDGTNSTSATNPIRGSSKAWVNFDGGTTAIRASYNVSSVTRNSNGNYSIFYTNALPDTNYAVLTTPYDNSSGATDGLSTYLNNTATAYVSIIVGRYSLGVYDATNICVSIFD